MPVFLGHMALTPGEQLGPYEILAPLGARRHGRGVPGARHAAAPRGRAQAASGRRGARRRQPPSLRPGDARRRGAQPSEHPRDPRHGLVPRGALRGHRAARGRDARPTACAMGLSIREGRRGRVPDRRRPGRGARPRDHPPRHQARQHLPDERGTGEDPRLRHRPHRAARPDLGPLRHHHELARIELPVPRRHRRATCPPSRSAASRSTGAPTSSRSGRPSSRCSPAAARSRGRRPSRRSAPCCATIRASTRRPGRSRTI